MVEFLRPDDFGRLAADLSKTLGPAARCVEISKTKQFFRWAYDSELIEKPIRYGPDFTPPSAADLRKHRQKGRQEHGPRMFEADQVRAILQAAGPEVRAIILLGINCGFGNTDVARLSMSNLDLARGWVGLARSKTGTDRRCPLWPETVEALQVVLDRRKEPKNNAHAGLVFLTQRRGTPYVNMTEDGQMRDQITAILKTHLENLGIRRPGLSFYTLRHTFETIAGESKDQVAVNAIMGHVDSSMASHYRERIDDCRLRAVVDHVRAWLFSSSEQG